MFEKRATLYFLVLLGIQVSSNNTYFEKVALSLVGLTSK